MSFLNRLFGKKPAEEPSPTGHSPTCDTCGRKLAYAGNPLAHVGDDNAHTWRGTVCTACGHVYCDKCNVVDAVPCPKCGTKLKPAMVVYLRQAGRL